MDVSDWVLMSTGLLRSLFRQVLEALIHAVGLNLIADMRVSAECACRYRDTTL